MNRKQKAIVGGGAASTVTGTAVALGGKTALWTIFSAGPGAALTGAAETSAFLAWVGGGSLAAGGGGMVAGTAILAALGPVGLGAAAVGATIAGVTLYRAKKNRKEVTGPVRDSLQAKVQSDNSQSDER